jgi:magnesium chelatase family protein
MGIDAYIVEAEADISSQFPAFSIVGMPTTAVKESRERVMAAIKNSGFIFPQRRVTINLAPADIRKEGSAFDLPIALGILGALTQVETTNFDKFAILGELSLDGTLKPIRGALPISIAVKKEGIPNLILPKENSKEAAIVDGLSVYPANSLLEVIQIVEERSDIQPENVDIKQVFEKSAEYHVDFRDVKGQLHVKRALEVSAAGGHNVIMIGPPGSGKTMLARRVPTILPNMSLDEALEVTKIHSVAGLLAADASLIATRPFRAPHHTISDAGLIGGGHYPSPGEVSLSHNGVLFLDELPEFKRNVLEVMRQPLEDGHVTISRSSISLTFPSRFMLIAAMNPCPCGYYGDSSNKCTCTTSAIQRYMSKISGPLLDRIDIHVEVPAVKYKELSGKATGETSADIRTRVNRTRDVQLERFKRYKNIFCNAHMRPREIRKFCNIDDKSSQLLKMAITKLGLSARAYDRILKVSRTIADLEGEAEILPQHVSEAIQYRSLDRQMWM